MIRVLIVALLCMLNSVAYVPSDQQSKVTFQIRNFGVTVDGSFTGLKGAMNFDETKPDEGRVDFSVDASTIDTGIGLRNNHLKKKEYFDVATYPTLSFASQQLTKQGSAWMAKGKLKIKNVVKEISFPFDLTEQTDGLRLKGTFTIDRTDFGVGGGSISMGDDVVVKFDIVVVAGQ
jgi:polyisoprenoid-binding protein YceI